MKPQSSERGFSLLETLIAFAIMALSLSVLLPSLSNMLSRSSDRNLTWLAGELALSLEAENLVVHDAVPGARTGSWDRLDWTLSTSGHRLDAPGQAGVSRHYLVSIRIVDRDTGTVLVDRDSIRIRATEQ